MAPHWLRLAAASISRSIIAASLAAAIPATAWSFEGKQPPSAGPAGFQLWVTSRDLSKRLTPEPAPVPDENARPTVQVDTTQQLQRIDGFGAAFTDSSAWLLHTLPRVRRDIVMRELFGRGDGIKLSLMRVPMGSSDFTRTGTWSYADDPQDDTLPRFSTRHDDAYIVPVLRQAQRINPDMRLFANPWSPPGWMKTNGSMLGTWKHTTLRADKYTALATYFVKFLQDYARKGVHVWGITPQNEPNQDPESYPGMYLSPEDQSRFIVDHLVPALRKAGLTPAILAADISSADPVYGQALLRDPRLLPLVQAMAWHCYQELDVFAKGLAQLRDMVPDRPMYVTECSTGPGGHIAGNTTEKTLTALANGAGGMVLWNLALDPAGGPKMGVGCELCTGLVTIDPKTGRYDYTLNYYELGQFSRFIRAGAYRLKSEAADGIWAQAFRNPDGSIALVAYNSTDAVKDVAIRIDAGQPLRISLAAHATGTMLGRSRPAN